MGPELFADLVLAVCLTAVAVAAAVAGLRTVRRFRDSEERLAHLEQMAMTDDLTGLPNRSLWEEQLPRASAWRGALRPYDVLARYGGEEFSLMLPGCGLREAAGIVERLRDATPHRVSCSAGIAEWDREEHPSSLVGRADVALYGAKAAGRDRTVASHRPG